MEHNETTAIAVIKPTGTKLQTKLLPRGMEVVLMTPEQWFLVEGIDVQRDTERHAKRIKPLLQAYRTPHCEVHAARLPDGSLVKLNGHSRDHLWHTGQAPAPEMLIVLVHRVDSMSAARFLYSFYDSGSAVESKGDQVFGTVRMMGATFQSDYCKSSRFSSALATASGNRVVGIAARTQFWMPELLEFDRLNANRETFINPVVGVALLTIRKHRNQAMEFWRRFAEDGGTKLDEGSDAIEALSAWLKMKKASGWGNAESQKEIAQVTLWVFEAWVKNRDIRFKRVGDLSKKRIDLSAYRSELGM